METYTKDQTPSLEAIAHYMYFEGTWMTIGGNYIFSFEELSKKYGVPVEFFRKNFDDIAEILLQHQGVLDVWGEEETGDEIFDINFGTSYCGLTDTID